MTNFPKCGQNPKTNKKRGLKKVLVPYVKHDESMRFRWSDDEDDGPGGERMFCRMKRIVLCDLTGNRNRCGGRALIPRGEAFCW